MFVEAFLECLFCLSYVLCVFAFLAVDEVHNVGGLACHVISDMECLLGACAFEGGSCNEVILAYNALASCGTGEAAWVWRATVWLGRWNWRF